MMTISFQSAINTPPVPHMQDFVPILASIFTNVKNSELKDCKILLLFTEDNSAADRWLEIEKEYIKENLPDAQGNVQKNYDLKRKPFVHNDLKALYDLRSEDVHYLADLVEKKVIAVKSSKATKSDSGKNIVSQSSRK